MTKQELLPGNIQVTYPHGDGCDYVSTVRGFVEVRVNKADWALLALGARMRDCEFRTRDLDLIGMKREHMESDVSR